MYSNKPRGPSKTNLTSGIRQQSTSLEAKVANIAICPEWRPMSFTNPIPLIALRASTCAHLIARCASSTAVSKPNDLSMSAISLSIKFGFQERISMVIIIEAIEMTYLWSSVSVAVKNEGRLLETQGNDKGDVCQLTPQTETRAFLLFNSWNIFSAPRCVPSPPMMYT